MKRQDAGICVGSAYLLILSLQIDGVYTLWLHSPTDSSAEKATGPIHLHSKVKNRICSTVQFQLKSLGQRRPSFRLQMYIRHICFFIVCIVLTKYKNYVFYLKSRSFFLFFYYLFFLPSLILVIYIYIYATSAA